MKLWSAFTVGRAIHAKCQTSQLSKVIRSLLLQIMVMFGTFNFPQGNMGLQSCVRLTNWHQLDPWFFKWHAFCLSFQTHITFYIWITISPPFPCSQYFERKILEQQELQDLQALTFPYYLLFYTKNNLPNWIGKLLLQILLIMYFVLAGKITILC